jgi:hypothetical protein
LGLGAKRGNGETARRRPEEERRRGETAKRGNGETARRRPEEERRRGETARGRKGGRQVVEALAGFVYPLGPVPRLDHMASRPQSNPGVSCPRADSFRPTRNDPRSGR